MTPAGDGFACASCGQRHDGLPDAFGAALPDYVAAVPEAERAARVSLDDETCILDGEHFFLRVRLVVPVHGRDAPLCWTLWSTLSGPNFERTLELWDTPGRESEPAYFGWLSNQVPGYPPTVPLPLHVHTQPVGTRPLAVVLEEAHPLARDQRDGIPPARADALAHAALDPSA